MLSFASLFIILYRVSAMYYLKFFRFGHDVHIESIRFRLSTSNLNETPDLAVIKITMILFREKLSLFPKVQFILFATGKHHAHSPCNTHAVLWVLLVFTLSKQTLKLK